MSSLGIANAPARPSEDSAPKFLIEWEPRWEAFTTAVRPALERSPAEMRQQAHLLAAPASPDPAAIGMGELAGRIVWPLRTDRHRGTAGLGL